jgi:hypothetical protein
MHRFSARRTWLRIFIITIACVVVCSISYLRSDAASAVPSDDDHVVFGWAFGALVKTGKGTETRLESVTRDRALKTGDKFKMMVEPKKKCFVYVIYNSSQGEVKLLFPYNLDQFDKGYEVNKRYYLPGGDQDWFELDSHTGMETFYVLASAERLTSLESLLGQYQSSEPEKKPEIAKQVLDEIHNLRKQHWEVATAAERPVRIGGSIRGLDQMTVGKRPDISAIANDVTATDFFGRTFTIDHQ